MRKFALITSIFILMIVNTTAFANESDEMTDLASLVTGSDLSVDSWQVTIKEKMSKDAINRVLQKLKNKNSYKVSSTEDENTVKYFFGRGQKNAKLSESYSVVIPKNPMYEPELVAVLQGDDWNDKISVDYIDRINDIHMSYFTKKSTKFACLSTTIGGKIDSGYFFERLKKTLQLSNIREQTDNVEHSTVKKIMYGYTPIWEQSIKMKQPMNFQAVVENAAQNSVRLTIGTPILINEY
ncbi:MAG TPA: YwmB family TATA-box binding protein [Lentibacillus sp.]|uniref:YwmB family TATA-box binding protein n=1 Tax=Lentibacillus sp. TaxID=1925746 RepID=UPI002B4B7D1F|nr:YwmB family TATA-box binding protein [Lentibacillus sp.]HLR61483.1 YwmB family TATA-box binding protein [Lentibacillus sp.]